MNICKCFKCDTCNTLIDCRVGMSNRGIQPFQFACPKCEQRITFTIGCEKGDLEGATDILEFEGPFKGVNPFVDLHLDFPVYSGKYVKGMTTFFRVLGEIGQDAFGHLAHRLEVLNMLHPFKKELENAITQYKKGNINNFEKICSKIPGVNLRSQKKEDVLAAIYTATSIMSSPFTIMEDSEELSEEFPKIYIFLHENYHDKTIDFIDEIIKSGFIGNLHRDCLTLYPKIVQMDLPLRPALFYDYVDEANYKAGPARVSTDHFDSCNNYYKDLAEVFSRQLTLLAGLNNLLKRGDYNEFEPSLKMTKKQGVRKELLSLNTFADVDLGSKIQFIDDCFYSIDMKAIDNRLRNGIAHYKYNYNEMTQIITYYPSREGMSRLKEEEISFMEFLRKTLLLFREIHNLNHLIKATLYYCVLILKKDV
ncbi:TPA: hypothetical protein MPI41_003800 [Klebsiella pneumoniae]|nr:hypothetical protein [Klebsiella pneumoniae]HBZ2602599.1 hypothetical protein [Klebsiella pneumoniae]HCA3732294.1 hypothetical protein [Klebsiella pneumoniae]HCA3824792.1 hypothetical protein [Klebsiella pneumoniae]HCM3208673.1 hypothetical protein [Klebsiella pneumoniae]